MSYEGRQSAKAVEQDFPHFVDIKRRDCHAQHGIEPKRGHGRHDANGSVIRWCFSKSAVAEAFASEFRDT
jgi:hypothetical protein